MLPLHLNAYPNSPCHLNGDELEVKVLTWSSEKSAWEWVAPCLEVETSNVYWNIDARFFFAHVGPNLHPGSEKPYQKLCAVTSCVCRLRSAKYANHQCTICLTVCLCGFSFPVDSIVFPNETVAQLRWEIFQQKLVCSLALQTFGYFGRASLEGCLWEEQGVLLGTNVWWPSCAEPTMRQHLISSTRTGQWLFQPKHTQVSHWRKCKI